MGNKLSFSSINRYNKCGRSYDYHYNKRLRERTVSSFLGLGSAIDSSLNAILNDFKANKKVSVNYKEVFDDNWEYITINKKQHILFDCTLVGYQKDEFDEELLKQEDLLLIDDKRHSLAPEFASLSIRELKDKLEESRTNMKIIPFSVEHHKMLNILNYLSTRRKAHLMLQAYVREIVPQLEDVKEVQYPIELVSDNDSMIGYIDAIVKFKGDSHYSVLDNKTSSSAYEQSDVSQSQQLALYCYSTGLKHAAFGVMLKNIRMNREKTCSVCNYKADSGSRHKTCSNEVNGKRCNGTWNEVVNPEAVTQLFKDEIPEDIQNVYVNNISDINDAINTGIFVQNLSSCYNWYGQKCPYLEKCFKNKEDNLEKV